MTSAQDGLTPRILDPQTTPSGVLAALVSPLKFFITVTLTFSILGGALQVVGATRGPVARSLSTALTVHVAGNLVASGITIAFVFAAFQLAKQPRRISVGAALVGGATGGAARLPLELAVGTEITGQVALASIVTEAAWFVIAALATNLITHLARNERDTRDALQTALTLQNTMRTQMLNADTQLRRDVAEWLHGHLQAELLLTAEQARTLGAAGTELAERLNRLRDNELRSFAHSLHPTSAELNLVGALQELAKRFASSTQVTVNADTHTIREALPAPVAVATYRACEEALANAVKHGRASTVSVTLTQDPDANMLHVVVDDNGAGAPKMLEPGLGLTMVDTYLRAVDGTWDLRFTQPHGATFSVAVPLQR